MVAAAEAGRLPMADGRREVVLGGQAPLGPAQVVVSQPDQSWADQLEHDVRGVVRLHVPDFRADPVPIAAGFLQPADNADLRGVPPSGAPARRESCTCEAALTMMTSIITKKRGKSS